MSKARVVLFILLSFSILSLCSAQDEHAPSTREERQRLLALTRKLEHDPLDKSLYAEKKWAKQWLEDIPDINVTICAPVLFGGPFTLPTHTRNPGEICAFKLLLLPDAFAKRLSKSPT